jgi:hypothetical protein
MILKVHVPGARSYQIGNEIWQHSLAESIHAEAAVVAEDAKAEALESAGRANRRLLQDRVIAEMTEALVHVGDRYLAPAGVRYSLMAGLALDPSSDECTLVPVKHGTPTVDEVLRFEDLPLGSLGTRRALVRWSDGTEGEALRWYADEVLVCDGDLIGKTEAELRSLHFRRDRDWLQS